MSIQKRTTRRRSSTAVILILVVAAVFSLSGCTRPGNSNPSGAEASAEPSLEAEYSPSPAPLQSDSPGSTAKAQASAEPQAVLDPAKLAPVFGFADETGDSILITREDEGEDARMQSLDTAIGNGGQVLEVKLEKWQTGSGDSNGRELANNIPNLSGYLFKVEGGKAEPDATYYLADSASLPKAALLEVHPADPAGPQLSASDPLRERISGLKKREIHAAWKLAALGGDSQLYLVQFAREGQSMLFSLILEQSGRLTFMDYPAEIQNNEYSVWRVDDGGEVTPEMFSVLFAAHTADGLLLGLNWWGAEGVNTFFLSQQGEIFKGLDIEYGRYTSPL